MVGVFTRLSERERRMQRLDKTLSQKPKLVKLYEEKFPRQKAEPKWRHMDKDAIKRIRLKTGLSQAQFCRMFGFNSATLRNWERGANSPEPFNNLLLRMIDYDYKSVLKLLEGVSARQATEV